MMYSSSATMIWTSIIFIALATATIPPVYLSLTSRSSENTAMKTVFGKKLGLASIAHSLGYAVGMGLIAISLKKHIISENLVVLMISLFILVLSALMVAKIKDNAPIVKTEV